MSGLLTKADYPPNWSALRQVVRLRADDCCECRGECGGNHCRTEDPHGRCSAPHHALIVRNPKAPQQWWPHDAVPWSPSHMEPLKRVRVVLTIAHLCQDSTCDNLEHLRAMCQRCHLVYDQKQHRENAMRTRRRRKQAAGQLDWLDQEDTRAGYPPSS